MGLVSIDNFPRHQLSMRNSSFGEQLKTTPKSLRYRVCSFEEINRLLIAQIMMFKRSCLTSYIIKLMDSYEVKKKAIRNPGDCLEWDL